MIRFTVSFKERILVQMIPQYNLHSSSCPMDPIGPRRHSFHSNRTERMPMNNSNLLQLLHSQFCADGLYSAGGQNVWVMAAMVSTLGNTIAHTIESNRDIASPVQLSFTYFILTLFSIFILQTVLLVISPVVLNKHTVKEPAKVPSEILGQMPILIAF